MLTFHRKISGIHTFIIWQASYLCKKMNDVVWQ